MARYDKIIQEQNKSTNGNEDAVKKAEQKLDDYVFEKYKWSKYIQYNDYEEIRHYTNEYEDQGIWFALDGGIKISIENVPQKFLDMNYDSEPRTI